jgi:hypothetical protein
VGLVVVFSGIASAFGGDAPTSAEQLRSKLESVLKIKDTNGIVGLFNSEMEANEARGSAGVREMLIMHQAGALLQTSNASVKLMPMPAGFPFPQTNELTGLCTKFNIPVVGVIEVKSQNGSVQQLPYGKKGDGFYLAGINQEKLPGQFLDVRVLTGPNTDFLTYTGRWVYVKDGHEISVEISDKTNRFVTAWGDYIKCCEIRRTSIHEIPGFATWFDFQVIEGETHVFESPELTNEDLFTYQRK